MTQGRLSLKAHGYGLPSACLSFDNETICHDSYKPFVGLFGVGGKGFTAFRCFECSFITFEEPSQQ